MATIKFSNNTLSRVPGSLDSNCLSIPSQFPFNFLRTIASLYEIASKKTMKLQDLSPYVLFDDTDYETTAIIVHNRKEDSLTILQPVPNIVDFLEDVDDSDICGIQVSTQTYGIEISTDQQRKQIETISAQHSFDEIDEPKIHSQISKFLIYFKTLDKKVKEVLSSRSKMLNRTNLQTLNCLKGELDTFLHNFEAFYYGEEIDIAMEAKPQFQELISGVSKLYEIFDQLEESQIPDVLKSVMDPSDDHFLACILGLEEEDIVKFLSDPDNHLTKEQLVLEFIDQKSKVHGFESLKWESAFKCLGFTSVKSKILAELSNSNPYSGHFTPLHLAKRHIEHQFMFNILLRPSNSGIASRMRDHKIRNIGKEYTIPTMVDPGEMPLQILAINKVKPLFYEGLFADPCFSKYVNQCPNPLSKVTYWFHATDHQSAFRIITDGIDVDWGSRKLDFSDGEGFYLSSSLSMAWEWPKVSKKAREAIVIFKSDSNIFSNAQGLEFNEDDLNKWRQLVMFYRSGKNAENLNVRDELNAKKLKYLDYIFGPIAIHGINEEKPLKTEEGVHYQLCLKSQNIADDFYEEGKNVHKVIFFSEGPKFYMKE